jgi:8-oxo-dGTP pyrophosphatase MutT (NUDIX family)
MTLDFNECGAIQPTLCELRRHFDQNRNRRPEPIRHPESLAFQARFENRYSKAAVLIPIVRTARGLDVILTRRAEHLRHHPGQISFPGGGHESLDNTLHDTALRETHEEIGIAPKHVQILGQLGHYYTVSGYRVTPVVGLINEKPALTLDPNEVCDALFIPLNFLMDPANFSLCEVVHSGETRHYYSAHYQNAHIWGVTAGIIMAFYESLKGAA